MKGGKFMNEKLEIFYLYFCATGRCEFRLFDSTVNTDELMFTTVDYFP